MNLLRTRNLLTTCVIGVALTSGLKAQSPSSQATPPPTPKPAVPGSPVSVYNMVPVDYQIVPLRYARAADLAASVAQVYKQHPSIRLSPEERTNVLIVAAPAADMPTLKALVSELDQAAQNKQSTESRVNVLSLAGIQANAALKESLRLLESTGRVRGHSIDTASNSLVVASDEQGRAAAEELLRRLRDSNAGHSIREARIRVIWVSNASSNPEDKPLSPLGEDLREVVPALSKLGIGRPVIVTQVMTTAVVGESFSVEGSPTGADGEHLWFGAQGVLQESAAGARLKIELTGRHIGVKEPAFRVSSSIVAPSGQIVVLGMAPTMGSTSAFIVQAIGSK